MKNKYRKFVKNNNLIPLKELSQLNELREVYGVGWDGEFQKGVVNNDNRYVKFVNEMGGTKAISKGWVDFGNENQYRTVYSGLFITIS